MVQILKIEKTGDITYSKTSDINELYKKCGFRKSEGFGKITSWEKNIETNNVNIELWGRTNGKPNIKNNYEFPQPFNKTIYGNCCLIQMQNNAITDLDKDLWDKLHIVDKSHIVDKTSTPIINHLEKTHTIPIENTISSKCVLEKTDNKKTDNDDSDDDMSISEDDDYPNSELKEDSYIYSSEDES